MTTQRDTTAPSTDTRSPAAHQAFLLLRTVFTVAFFAAAAEAMRRILVENARRKNRASTAAVAMGSTWIRGLVEAEEPSEDLLASTPPSKIGED